MTTKSTTYEYAADGTTRAAQRLAHSFSTGMLFFSLVLLGMVTAGCGGGSAGVSSQVVSGTAAVGTPLAGKVSLKDSSGTPREKSTVIASDGTFAIDVTDMKAPYVLQAKGTADGKSYTLHSYADNAGTANINPLSDAIVACAADVDDPSEAYEKADHDHNIHIGDKLASSVATILGKLQPLLQQYNAEHTNPITAHYIANHLGLDDLFDHVKITVVNGTLSIINGKSGAVIFTGSLNDIANGLFDGGALPPATTVPAAPTALSAHGGDARVALTWSAVTAASTYNVYWATAPGVTPANGSKISSVTGPYVHTGLAPSTTYYYVVTAVNSAGESAASPQASTTTSAAAAPQLTPPTGVTATGGTSQVTVSWSAVSSATSYNIYYATASGVGTTTGTKIANATAPAVLTGLNNGTTYYFVVTAANANGESAASAQVSAAPLSSVPTPTLPAAPAGVVATSGTNQVSLSWSAVTGATSYNVYYATSSGVTKANGTKVVNAASPYVQTGLSVGTTYYFIVTAVNAAGEGTASATVAGAALDGMALYNSNCSGCHGTSKLGKTATAIQGAISANTGGMGYLGTLLKSAEIAAIASASAPAPVLDGAALYATYCNSCHGASKRGKTVAAIQGAIAANRGGMGSLSTLTTAQITAISLY